MRSSRDLIAVLLLLALFVAGGLLLGGRGPSAARPPGPEPAPNPSSTNARGSGMRGAFVWTQKLGYEPVAWQQSWSRLSPSENGVLLIAGPQVAEPVASLTGSGGSSDPAELTARDAMQLRRWLNSGSGHSAILLASRLASSPNAAHPTADDPQTFGDAMDLIAESASPDTGRTEFAPLQPVSDTMGMLSLHSESDARLKRTRGDSLALFADKAGPLVLIIPVGKGRLIAVADDAVFSNSQLSRSENAVFLANLLAHYGTAGGRVLFDEYHHGDAADAGGSVWEDLGRPLQLALIQLCFAGLALLVLLSVRFGPPVPAVRLFARSSADYVGSLASLYRRAGASQTALETLYRQFLRDICGRLALPPDVDLERLAAVAARRGQIDKERLRRLLATCELRLDQGKVSEAELLDLTRQMESIRKEIGIA